MCVDHLHPFSSIFPFRQFKIESFIMSIEHQVKTIVNSSFTFRSNRSYAFSIHENRQRFCIIMAPVFFRHLTALRKKPRDIFHINTFNWKSTKPKTPSEVWMLLTEVDQLLSKGK